MCKVPPVDAVGAIGKGSSMEVVPPVASSGNGGFFIGWECSDFGQAIENVFGFKLSDLFGAAWVGVGVLCWWGLMGNCT